MSNFILVAPFFSMLSDSSRLPPYFTVIYPDFVTELLPLEFLTVKLTVYFPVLLYLCMGFLAVDGLLLSPKSQRYDAGEPVLLSMNSTVSGALPDIRDAENAATGGIKAFTVI
jgi:hypothetical protein